MATEIDIWSDADGVPVEELTRAAQDLGIHYADVRDAVLLLRYAMAAKLDVPRDVADAITETAQVLLRAAKGNRPAAEKTELM